MIAAKIRSYSLYTQDGDKTGYKEANPHEPISGKIVFYAFLTLSNFAFFVKFMLLVDSPIV